MKAFFPMLGICLTVSLHLFALKTSCDNEDQHRKTAIITWVGGSGTGTQRTTWNRAANWSSNTIPNSTNDVVIAATTYQPIVTNSATQASCKSLTIDAAATLTVSTSSSGCLNVNGNVTNNGTLYFSVNPSGSSQYLQLWGTSASLNGSGTWSNVPVYFNPGCFYTLSADIRFTNFYLDNNASVIHGAITLWITKSLIQKGTWNLAGSTVNFSGDDGTVSSALTPNYPDLNAVLFSAGTSTFNYSSITANKLQYITACTYYNISININGTNKIPVSYYTSASATSLNCHDLSFVEGTTVTSGYAYLFQPIFLSGNLTIGNNCMLDANDHSSTTGTFTTDNPIYIGGNWTNNGTFTNGFANGLQNNSLAISNARTVVFNGSGVQSIAGSSSTSFYNLSLNKTGGSVSLNEDSVQVDNTLDLKDQTLDLNARILRINSASGTAIQRTSGYILSENSAMLGKLKRITSALNTEYIFPFGYNSQYIPFSIRFSNGNMGVFSVATYHAATPHPLPPGVSSIRDTCYGRNDSAYMVKRFWQLENYGAGGTANMQFTYADNEIPIENSGIYAYESNLKAERYGTDISSVDAFWQTPETSASTQSYSPDSNTVFVYGVTQFSPWMLVKGVNALPVQWLEISGKTGTGNIVLNWETAIEIDNDCFIIEKIKNGQFQWLSSIKGAGNSSLLKKYELIDYHPDRGENIYRIKQVDINGNCSGFKSVVVFYMGLSPHIAVHNFRIEINIGSVNPEDSELEIFDSLGKCVLQKKQLEFYQGYAGLDLTNLSHGLYFIKYRNKYLNLSQKIIL